MDKTWTARIKQEGLLKSEPALWVDSAALMQPGRLILTRKMLYFFVNLGVKPAIGIDLDTINRISPHQLHTDTHILALT